MRPITVFLFLLLSAPLSVAGQSNQVNDTLQVSGKAVVFYAPSQREYDSLSDAAKTEIRGYLDAPDFEMPPSTHFFFELPDISIVFI